MTPKAYTVILFLCWCWGITFWPIEGFIRVALAKNIAPCPDSPNCVSSQSEDPDYHINPLAYEDSREQAKERLLSLLRSLPRVKVVLEEPNYIKTEFTSAVLSFVDEVEFYFSKTEKIIHVRSASRVGYYDFGVNRRRIEDIRTRFEQEHLPSPN